MVHFKVYLTEIQINVRSLNKPYAKISTLWHSILQPKKRTIFFCNFSLEFGILLQEFFSISHRNWSPNYQSFACWHFFNCCYGFLIGWGEGLWRAMTLTLFLLNKVRNNFNECFWSLFCCTNQLRFKFSSLAEAFRFCCKLSQ